MTSHSRSFLRPTKTPAAARHYTRWLIALCGLLCSFHHHASAAIVTMSFEGRVDSIVGSDDASRAAIEAVESFVSVGDWAFGVLTYDDSAPNTATDPGAGRYFPTNVTVSLAVGRYAAVDDRRPGNSVVQIFTVPNWPGDIFHFGSGLTGGPIEGMSASGFSLSLVDYQGLALESQELPTSAPDLSLFGTSELRIIFGQGSEFVHVVATVTTLAGAILTGFSQENPILPNEGTGDITDGWRWWAVASMHWIDPPLAHGFVYEIAPGSLFTSILDFPTGFASPFTVTANGSVLGTFGPGQSADFVSLLGGGVSSFTITGIDPLVDAGNPLAFPLRLAFSTDTADVTMRPITGELASVPEPSTAILWLLGCCSLLLRRRRHAASPSCASSR